MSMKTLEIIKHPAESLRKPSKEVNPNIIETPEFQEFCDVMVATMFEKDGIGLAAPQVGKNIRVIVVNGQSGPDIFINPTITYTSHVMQIGEEGCLSVPLVWGIVERHTHVTIKAITRENKKIKFEAKDLDAIIFQHEIDHLDGILFIDKATEITRGKERLGKAL